ncbi:MAG TPA: hypothetical protein VHE79_13855, partial [Spirochaetia bacterium]
ELEPVEELEEAGAAEPGGDEVAALIAGGSIRTWTIADLQRMAEEARSSIVMEDGVFRIKEEVYNGSDRVRGPESAPLRTLAREVVDHETEATETEKEEIPAGGAEDAAVAGGIGDLIRDEESIDISKDIVVEKSSAAPESFPIDREKTNPLPLKRNGVDYDQFLSAYPRSFAHTTQMKSLVEVSRRVSAVSAGVFLRKVDGFTLDLTVGMGEKTVETLRFALTEPVSQTLLVPRMAFAIAKNPAEIAFLRLRFDEEDLRYIKRLLFLPATFRGQEAYLFLSFSGETDIVIETLVAKLLIE